jgi:hypothetical protein
MGLHVAAWSIGGSRQLIIATGYAFICLVLAIVCFSIGTWYYLNRIEP